MKITPNLPTNIVPTNIAWLKLSGEFPVNIGIPPLRIKIVIRSSKPWSGKDKGGPSKGGVLNNIVFSWILLFLDTYH